MNHLKNEKSPYLLQHADNPVNWYPWGENALQRAQDEGKPVLLSIGYSTCHWCHVMERESFEDEQVAAYMNAHFVNIKVDREERPDLDRIYMRVCELLTGSGGWPLNVFLLPDLRPFYAGTYFPPEPRYGRMSWTQLLQLIAYNFYEKPEVVEREAERVMQALQRGESRVSGIEKNASAQVFDEGLFYKRLLQYSDQEWGGFGQAPKFPQFASLSFLLAYGAFATEPAATELVVFTLEKMLQGGIYDQLGGGFARYATDRKWRIPHFEKMLYDNGLALNLLAEVWQIDKKRPAVRRALEETYAFLERELRTPEGGFYSALDADSEGREGAFYLWTLDELRRQLGEHTDWFASMYACSEEGNWEAGNILWRVKEPEEVAEALNLPLPEFLEQWQQAKEKLLAFRQMRFSLHRDDKVLLGWNALVVSGLAKAAQATGEAKFGESAMRTLTFLKSAFEHEGQWYHLWQDGRGKQAAFLTDVAYLIRAYLDLYEWTQDFGLLEEALVLAHYALDRFYDANKNQFYLTESGRTDDLILRPVEDRDGETPSGAAYLVGALLYLHAVFGEQRFADVSRKMLPVMASRLEEFPLAWASWAHLLLAEKRGWNELVVIGPKADVFARRLAADYYPARILLSSTKPVDLPLFKGRFQAGKTLLYHCHDFRCEPPKQVSQ